MPSNLKGMQLLAKTQHGHKMSNIGTTELFNGKDY
jgi:hypothetical protein